MKSVYRCRPQLRSLPCPHPSVATLPSATFLDNSCVPGTHLQRRRKSSIKLPSFFCCAQTTSYRAMSNSVPPTVRLMKISVIQIKYSQIKPPMFGLPPLLQAGSVTEKDYEQLVLKLHEIKVSKCSNQNKRYHDVLILAFVMRLILFFTDSSCL